MPTLYHYSPLVHLPLIAADGLRHGEVVVPTGYPRPPTAVSLTTQADPDKLLCWGGVPIPEKTAVRYTCRIPDDDPHLEPARDAWRRLGVPTSFVNFVAPLGQSKWWYFYRGLIPLKWFTVELRSRSGYVGLTAADLTRVCDLVAAERERFEFYTPPDAPWEQIARPKAGYSVDWLLTEAFPAERFLSPDAAHTFLGGAGG